METQEEFDRWIFSQTPQYYAAFPDKNPSAKPAVDTTKTTAGAAGKTTSLTMVPAKN